MAYDGFEPSGRMHIAQGVMKALNVNKLTRAGVTFTFWVADWFALMNNKMGGDLSKIQTVGRYMVEVWKAVGMDVDGGKVRFVSSSEEINSRASEYWPLVLDIARRNSLARVVRCSQIMGRAETDELAGAGLRLLRVFSRRDNYRSWLRRLRLLLCCAGQSLGQSKLAAGG